MLLRITCDVPDNTIGPRSVAIIFSRYCVLAPITALHFVFDKDRRIFINVIQSLKISAFSTLLRLLLSSLIVSGAMNILILQCCVFLDSERSEECIDFTMIITSRNNPPISNYGGGFRCKSEYPWCIIEVKIIKIRVFFSVDKIFLALSKYLKI
ncbi:Uncharacterized protein FWK35_00003597 [Aphis craccivora]|uniref:Uncharacterized protein n=1 Tax=Aphis craccivora TaxID=307492 RepID=A0A6G0ZKG0_APHCR|nr:Uncharacterized protein FWK35_00003597 [Aphis craccivora]